MRKMVALNSLAQCNDATALDLILHSFTPDLHTFEDKNTLHYIHGFLIWDRGND